MFIQNKQLFAEVFFYSISCIERNKSQWSTIIMANILENFQKVEKKEFYLKAIFLLETTWMMILFYPVIQTEGKTLTTAFKFWRWHWYFVDHRIKSEMITPQDAE